MNSLSNLLCSWGPSTSYVFIQKNKTVEVTISVPPNQQDSLQKTVQREKMLCFFIILRSKALVYFFYINNLYNSER